MTNLDDDIETATNKWNAACASFACYLKYNPHHYETEEQFLYGKLGFTAKFTNGEEWTFTLEKTKGKT